MKQTLTDNGYTNVVLSAQPAISLSGDFGGGTIALEFRELNTSTWTPLADGAYTAAGDIKLDFPRPVKVRGHLTGATAPELVYIVA